MSLLCPFSKCWSLLPAVRRLQSIPIYVDPQYNFHGVVYWETKVHRIQKVSELKDLDVSQIQYSTMRQDPLDFWSSLFQYLVYFIRWKLVIFTNGTQLTGLYLRWICIIRKKGFRNHVIRDDSTKKCPRNPLAIALPYKRWKTVTLL